jgi:ArsR family transcriptional regulator
MDAYDRIAVLLRAMAHPVRLQILTVLRVEEACVCHLEAVLGQRQAYISQQLMRLRDAGVVVDRREGMNVFYSLADGAIGGLLDAALEAAAAVTESPGAKAGLAVLSARPHPACTCPKCQQRAAANVSPEPQTL